MSYLRTNYRLTGSKIDVEGPSLITANPSLLLPHMATGYMWQSGESLFVLIGADGADCTYAVFHADSSGPVTSL